MGSLKSEKSQKDSARSKAEGSDSDTDKEDVSGRGSKGDSAFKPHQKPRGPYPPMRSLSPRSKNLQVEFQNLKQQILDGASSAVSPLLPSNQAIQ